MPGDMWSAFSARRRGCGVFVTAPLLDLNGPITCQHVAMKRRKVSYLGNVYRSYCEPVIYVSHAGRDGGIRGAFHAVALKSLSRVLLSHDLDVSIKHVRIKQEWA